MAETKALSVSQADRRGWLHADCTTLSIVQRCALVGLARSTHSYEPVPEHDENLMLMRLIDELYLKRPFYGVPRMTDWLCTGTAFTGRLTEAKIRISMDGRSRALDNVFVERLWRSVKYEEAYLQDYADGADAWSGLQQYFLFYNTERRHQSLGRRTPAEAHCG